MPAAPQGDRESLVKELFAALLTCLFCLVLGVYVGVWLGLYVAERPSTTNDEEE